MHNIVIPNSIVAMQGRISVIVYIDTLQYECVIINK